MVRGTVGPKSLLNLSLLAGIVLLSTAFAGCSGSAASALGADAPQWQSGYSWSFTTTGHYKSEGSADGRMQKEEGPIGPETRVAQVVNTSFSNGEEPVYLLAGGARDDETPEPRAEAMPAVAVPMVLRNVYLFALRQRDLNEVGVDYTSNADCGATGCTYSLSQLDFAADPGDDFLNFPLTRGKTWSHKATGDEVGAFDLPSDLEVEITGRVAGTERLDLPIGSVKTVKVVFDMKPLNVEEWKKNIKKEAEADGAQIKRLDFSFHGSRTVYYSPEYQHPARYEYEERSTARVQGTEDGHSFDFAFQYEGNIRSDLKGAKLAAEPERNLDYISKLVLGEMPLQDPGAVGVTAGSYRVHLGANKTVANAAIGDAVGFTTQLDGVEALPEGDRLHWSILDINGDAVAEGEGGEFRHVFREPGLYEARVEALDATGNASAGDALSITANYELDRSVTCGPASVFGRVSGCASEPIPVRPGIARLVVSAEPRSPASAINRGELLLTDPAGKRLGQGSAKDGRYTITISDFDKYAVNEKDWTLQWAQNVAVAEDVTYHVLLDYGAGIPMPEISAESGVFPHRNPAAPGAGAHAPRALEDLLGLGR